MRLSGCVNLYLVVQIYTLTENRICTLVTLLPGLNDVFCSFPMFNSSRPHIVSHKVEVILKSSRVFYGIPFEGAENTSRIEFRRK